METLLSPVGHVVVKTPEGRAYPRYLGASYHNPTAITSPVMPPKTQRMYAAVKTPTGHVLHHDAKAGVAPWSMRFRFAGNTAQVLVVLTMAVYMAGMMGYHTTFYSIHVTTQLKQWLHIPADQITGDGAPTENVQGHPEMLLPIYLLAVGMLPVFLGVLLVEFLGHFHVRRISSQSMLHVARVLRRKPAVCGKISHWSYGEWLVFLGLVGGNVFVFVMPFFARVDRTKTLHGRALTLTEYLEVVAVTLGFSCIFNLAFVFLPATRNSAWMEFFNISYAKGMKYHRWLVTATVFTGVGHCIGFYWMWIRQGTLTKEALPCLHCDLGQEAGRKVWATMFGQLALLVFLVIGLTSLPVVRRKCYNVYDYAQQLLFLAVVFAVMHWISTIWWIFPTFIVYCYGRARSMTSNFAPIAIQEFTVIDQDIVKVVIKRSPGRDGHYRVGQFLYLSVPAVSKLQWHPFTIASSPHTSPTTVTLLVKSLGDWTTDLVAHANECNEKNVLPTIYVDGFYGASLEMYDEFATVLLVAGGMGVASTLAILDDIVAKLANHETMTQRVVLAFSFRELALLEELHPVLTKLKALDPHERYFKTHFYLTRQPSDETLARRLDTDRVQNREAQPTAYASKATTPIAFAETLQSRMYRVLAFASVVVVAALLLIFLEYGGGKAMRGSYKNRWPLQGVLEPLMVMASAGIVFAYVFAEQLSKRKLSDSGSTASKEIELNVFETVGTPAFMVSDIHTYSDLLSHYRVVVGERPNTTAVVKEAFDFHNDKSVATNGKPVVGVFVSGPKAMKRAVAYAVHDIGASHFDIHEEEFEL